MAQAHIVLLLALAITLVPVAVLVNSIVPQPYMDEIFHIPQAQEYCAGHLQKWDPMITTFPGLYLVSLVYTSALVPAAKVLVGVGASFSQICSSPAVLRSLNVVLMLVCCLLFFHIVRHLEPNKSERKAVSRALLLSLYPLHWFFAFLYYTDVGSTTAVMAMYLAGLKRAYWTSSLFAAMAIMFRQTNVVWAIFVTCIGALEVLKLPADSSKKREMQQYIDTASSDGTLRLLSMDAKKVRRRRSEKQQHIRPDMRDEQGDDSGGGLVWEVHTLAKLAWIERTSLLRSFGPLLAVILAFIAFVLHNGSIVVGAKEAHKVSLHFAQMCYLGLVAAAAMAPVHFIPRRRSSLPQNNPRAWLLLLGTSALAFLAVRYFSIAHPYLLADNRHYTFYLWKKVIQSHWSSKYCLIPLYLFSWWSILNNLGKQERKLWIVVLVVGIAGVVVPAPLIELRYYTIPVFLIALHCGMGHSEGHEDVNTLFVAVVYVVINAITMYLFLYRSFEWTHEPGGVQRFMW